MAVTAGSSRLQCFVVTHASRVWSRLRGRVPLRRALGALGVYSEQQGYCLVTVYVGASCW